MLDWVAFVLLVVGAWLLRTVVSSLYLHIKKRIDDHTPDDLPIGAGAWLTEYDAEHCLGLRVYAGAPGTREVDAYLPSAHVITLSRDVYVKKDPSFWAVAAHELGHAIVYRSTPLVYVPLQLGRIVLVSATSFATVLIFANVLYARRDLDAIAFLLLHASLVGYAVLLVDEALASVVGLRILRRDPRVDRRGMFAACAALAAAYLTYVAGFAGQLLLVEQRGFVIAQIERHRHFVFGRPLGSVRAVVLVILGAALVLFAARALVTSLRSRKDASPADLEKRRAVARLGEIGRGVLACAMVALVYDQPAAPMLPLVCAAGILGSRAFVANVSAVLVGLVSGIVRSLVIFAALPIIVVTTLRRSKNRTRDVATNVVPSPLARTVPIKGPLDDLPLPQAIDDWSIESYRDPPWHQRASELAFPLVHVAFVVALFDVLAGARA